MTNRAILPRQRAVRPDYAGATVARGDMLASRYRSVEVPAGTWLNETETLLFQELSRAREPTSWQAHEVRDLARVARVNALTDIALDELARDGFTVMGSRGDVKINPLVLALTRLMGASVTMREKLGLSIAANRQHEAAQQPARRAAQSATVIEEADGLMAMPAQPE